MWHRRCNASYARANCAKEESETPESGGKLMLSWSLIFFVIAIIAGLLGFSGIAGAAGGIAKILFVIFLVLFLAAMLMRVFSGQPV